MCTIQPKAAHFHPMQGRIDQCNITLKAQVPGTCCCTCCASFSASRILLTGCSKGAGGQKLTDPAALTGCPAESLPSTSDAAFTRAVPRSSCCTTCSQLMTGALGATSRPVDGVQHHVPGSVRHACSVSEHHTTAGVWPRKWLHACFSCCTYPWC